MSLIGRLCVLDRIWRPTFLYFPTVLPRPAEVLQKKTESDETRRLLEKDLGEARRRLRRLLLEEREASQVAQTSCDEKWRKGWRRLLLEEAWGMPAKGCGDYSWRQPGEACGGLRRLLPEEACGSLQRAAETTPGDRLGA